MRSCDHAIAVSGDLAGSSQAHADRHVATQTEDESRRKFHGPFQGSGHFFSFLMYSNYGFQSCQYSLIMSNLSCSCFVWYYSLKPLLCSKSRYTHIQFPAIKPVNHHCTAWFTSLMAKNEILLYSHFVRIQTVPYKET